MLRALACVGLIIASPAAAWERLAGRTHVLDGDTIVVDGIHVRLKGVAAPEVEPAGEPDLTGSKPKERHITPTFRSTTFVYSG